MVDNFDGEQHLDNLRRKDSLRGAETAEISVRLGNYSASHFEGSAFECPRRSRQEVPLAGTAFDKAGVFLTQLSFDALGHLEGVITYGLDIQCDLKRQKVLERIQTHAVGNQRCPLR